MSNEELRKSPSGQQVEIEDVPPGNEPGDLIYWDGADWVPLSPPSAGSILGFTAAGLPVWVEGQAQGDLLYYDGNDWLRLPPGANSAVLQRANDIPAWTAAASQTSAWLIFDETTGLWVPQTVRERVFDNAYSPAGNWGLNLQTLVDSSGNGLDLSVASGVERYSYCTRTLGCARLLSTSLTVAGAQALLSPTGACSMLALCIVSALPAAQSLLVGYTNTGETEADNCQWGLFMDPDGSLVYTQENGAGVNSSHTVNSYTTVGQLAMIGFTKTAGQQVQLYLNGRVWGGLSAALTTPTGGSSARLRVGNDGGANFASISIASIAFYNSTLSTAQVVERFNYSVGRSSGFIS